MARYEFRSVFADEIKNYINDKTEAGFDGDNFRRNCRQPPLTVIRAILSGQTGTSPAINRYAAKGSLHE